MTPGYRQFNTPLEDEVQSGGKALLGVPSGDHRIVERLATQLEGPRLNKDVRPTI